MSDQYRPYVERLAQRVENSSAGEITGAANAVAAMRCERWQGASAEQIAREIVAAWLRVDADLPFPTEPDDDVVWTPSSGPQTLRYGVIYDEKPLTWRERLLSCPWRPWRKQRPPIAVIDFTKPDQAATNDDR